MLGDLIQVQQLIIWFVEKKKMKKNPYKLVLLLIDFRSDSFGNMWASWQQHQLWALSAEQVTLIFLGDSERASGNPRWSWARVGLIEVGDRA